MPRRVIAIVGATATGKTALAIDLALALNGEIINADSRQVYRGMDIGTAKPTAEQQTAVPHHLIDIVDPDETLTLAGFLDRANAELEATWKRGRQLLVVGGTGQYVWALLEGWRVPRVPPDRDLRNQLEDLAARDGPAAIMRELQQIDPASAGAIDPRNSRRVIRAIEVTLATGRRFSEWQERDPPDFDVRVIGLRIERPDLYGRIDRRVDEMIAAGLVEEVRQLVSDGYGCGLPSMSGIGYRQICQQIAGELTVAQAVARIKTETHRLARMQHAWFKPADRRIHWLDAESPTLVDDALRLLSDGVTSTLS